MVSCHNCQGIHTSDLTLRGGLPRFCASDPTLQTQWTALMRTTASGHADVAKLLLDLGANVNAADEVTSSMINCEVSIIRSCQGLDTLSPRESIRTPRGPSASAASFCPRHCSPLPPLSLFSPLPPPSFSRICKLSRAFKFAGPASRHLSHPPAAPPHVHTPLTWTPASTASDSGRTGSRSSWWQPIAATRRLCSCSSSTRRKSTLQCRCREPANGHAR